MSKISNGCLAPRNRVSEKPISRDWTPFAQNLALVLSRLEEDQFLIISAKNSNRFLQFSCQGAWGVRAEVTSNNVLKGESRLTRHQMAWLRSHC